MKSILLVEESPLLRAASASALATAGYQVVSAPDGAIALTLASHYALDLILLDRLASEPGKPELFQVLRNNAATSQIPVVVMSGEKTEDAREDAVAYLEKSGFDMKTFPKAVVEAVRKAFGGPEN